jgi:hypothetical protein
LRFLSDGSLAFDVVTINNHAGAIGANLPALSLLGSQVTSLGRNPPPALSRAAQAAVFALLDLVSKAIDHQMSFDR